MIEDAVKLAEHANIPLHLALLVANGARRASISLPELRKNCKRPHTVKARREVIVEARNERYSWWQIARAVNRDHATCIHSFRKATEE